MPALKNEYHTDEYGNTTSRFIRSTYNEMNQLVESIDSDIGETTAYTYDDYGNLINDGKATSTSSKPNSFSQVPGS